MNVPKKIKIKYNSQSGTFKRTKIITPSKTSSLKVNHLSFINEKRKSELSNRGMNDLKQIIQQLSNKNAEQAQINNNYASKVREMSGSRQAWMPTGKEEGDTKDINNNQDWKINVSLPIKR